MKDLYFYDQVYLEAMSVGLPIIASDVIGNSDTIVNGESGYLYKLNNINIAAQLINKLARDFNLRKMGNNAFIRQRFLKNFFL